MNAIGSQPAGNQDVWHYDLNVFPRCKDDNRYISHYADMPVEECTAYAKLLRKYFQEMVHEK
jgi:hypothetical protein